MTQEIRTSVCVNDQCEKGPVECGHVGLDYKYLWRDVVRGVCWRHIASSS